MASSSSTYQRHKWNWHKVKAIKTVKGGARKAMILIDFIFNLAIVWNLKFKQKGINLLHSTACEWMAAREKERELLTASNQNKLEFSPVDI